MTRDQEEAIEHALAAADVMTHEIYCKADYNSAEGRARLLEATKQMEKVWNEIGVELGKEVQCDQETVGTPNFSLN